MYPDVPYHPEQCVTVNQIQLTYDSFGERRHPAIILIMGLATQMIFWDELFCRALANQGFWVIRFDNRDIGKSSWMTGSKTPGSLAFILNVLWQRKIGASYSLQDMAKDTLGLMDSLELPQAHVIGASMGGMIAQIMALSAPHRIQTLTSIMSTTGNRQLPRVKNKTALQLLNKPARSVSAYVKQATAIWQILHGNVYPFDAHRVAELLLKSRQRGFNPDGINRQFAAILDAPDRTRALACLAVPTLVLHGEADPLLPVECGIATAKAVPQAKLVTYAGMGHTLPPELYGDIITEIVTFIASHSGRC